MSRSFDRHLLQPTTGTTSDGVAWKWQDGPLPRSRMLLYPDVGVPSVDDRWRHEESLTVVRLLQHLGLPKVEIRWIEPTVPSPRWRREDCAPLWEMGYEEHPFLLGIVDKLFDTLEFDGPTPKLLADEWLTCHEDDFEALDGGLPLDLES